MFKPYILKMASVLVLMTSLGHAEERVIQDFIFSLYATGKQEDARTFLNVMEKKYIPEALYMKGVLLLNGCYNNGIRNSREASIYFAKAAALNFPPALSALADSFLDGDGTPKDEKEAFRLYKKAADMGDGAGQFNVAILYRDGTGTKQSIKQALYYLDLAAENESLGSLREDAQKLHDSIIADWNPQ